MRFRPIAFAFVFLLLAVPGRSQPCSDATYQGTYYSLRQTTVNGLPFLEFDKITADGKGGLSLMSTVNVNGSVSQVPSSGTYQVNADCSGTQIVGGGATPTGSFEMGKGGHTKLFTVPVAGTSEVGDAYRAATQCSDASLFGTYGGTYFHESE